MAKVNLWLRGARGKFAGASLAKGADGETIAREVVTPSNPNTDKQLYQRMIMATVMAAYAAGKEIFDHSFQGRKVGSECQQEFMQRNLLDLRTRLAKDLADIADGSVTSQNCKTIVVGPKTRTPVPGRFLISDGNYHQQFFTIMEDDGAPVLGIPADNSTQATNDTIEEYAKRNNLVPGDIYTICAFTADIEDDAVWLGVDDTGKPTYDAWDSQLPCYFQFIRLQVKNDVLENTNTFHAFEAGALSKIFELTAYRNNGAREAISLNMPTSNTFVCRSNDPTATATTEPTALGVDFNVGSFGIIRSRYDQDLRSKTVMSTFYNDTSSTASVQNELLCGISAGSALTQWRRAVESLGASSLILESNS